MHDNLTSTERKALFSLRSRSNTVIKPGDKGSATVVMSRQDYLTKVMSHLQNKEFLSPAGWGTHIMLCQKNYVFFSEMTDRKFFDKETCNYLRPQDPQTSWFYVLPKIHKEGNSGRSIVSSCGGPTESMSQVVDHHLYLLVIKRIPSYIKDATDFLSKLRSVRVSVESLLLTLDVSSLYTNIPHEEGTQTYRKLLNKRDI